MPSLGIRLWRSVPATAPVRSSPDRYEEGDCVESNPLHPGAALEGTPLGPLGVSLAQELAALPCQFVLRKRFRWPWSSRYQPLSPQQVAQLLEGQDPARQRLMVKTWDQPVPLRNLGELAAFQFLEFGLEGRVCPPDCVALEGGYSFDQRGLRLGAYETYLKSKEQEQVWTSNGDSLVCLSITSNFSKSRTRRCWVGSPKR